MAGSSIAWVSRICEVTVAVAGIRSGRYGWSSVWLATRCPSATSVAMVDGGTWGVPRQLPLCGMGKGLPCSRQPLMKNVARMPCWLSHVASGIVYASGPSS